MHFLNPVAFWAFLLLLIPIIIHLFNFRRLKKVYFSNLTFLHAVNQQRKSRSSLKKLLILCLRLLAFTFLILAFARPVTHSENVENVLKDELIYLDNSNSMQQTDATGEPLLYVAHSLVAAETAPVLKNGGHVRYLDNDRSVALETGDALPEMSFSATAPHLADMVEKAHLYHPEVLHIFSDFQKNSTFPIEELLQDSSTEYHLHQLTAAQPHNIYLDSVYLEGTSGLSGDHTLKIRISNESDESVKDLAVKLEKAGQQVAALTADIAASGQTELSVDLGANETAYGDYQVTVEDNPVVFDNALFFRINPTSRSTVVILSDKNSTSQAYFEKVFSNEAYFHGISESVEQVSYENLLKADLIILAGLREIPSWFTSQREQMKGRVLLVPAPAIDLNSYQSALHVTLAADPSAQRTSVSERSLENPFFNGIFSRKTTNMSLPEARNSYTVTGFTEPVLTLNSGADFLLKAGETGIYFLTSALTDSLTNFHKHSLFVPVMYKLAQSDQNTRLFYRLDESSISLQTDSIFTEEVITLAGQDGTYIPTYHFQDGRLILQLPDVMKQAGFYDLLVKQDTICRLALNYPKSESEIAAVSEDEIRKYISGYEHITYEAIDSGAPFAAADTNDQNADALWKYALILALIFLITESVLLRFI